MSQAGSSSLVPIDVNRVRSRTFRSVQYLVVKLTLR